MHVLAETGTFPYTNDIMRNDAQVAVWRLGEYLKLLRNADTRAFIEGLQHLADAIVVGIDEDESTFSTTDPSE